LRNFYRALRGFYLKEFLADPVGEEPYLELINAGARLLRDYREYATAIQTQFLSKNNQAHPR